MHLVQVIVVVFMTGMTSLDKLVEVIHQDQEAFTSLSSCCEPIGTVVLIAKKLPSSVSFSLRLAGKYSD